MNQKKIFLWRGYHHHELIQLFSTTWEKKELLILVPPHLRNFAFMKEIDHHQIELRGDWPAEIKALLENHKSTQTNSLLLDARIGVFTSGTGSGQSRLIFYTQDNVCSSLEAIRELFSVQRIKKIFCYPQPTHTFGLVLGYLHAFLNKIELQFSEGPYSHKAHEKWLQTVDANTLTLGAPTHFSDLIQYVHSHQLIPPASYSCIIGGARVTGELWENIREHLKIEAPSVGYGATEASPGVTHLHPGIRPSEDGDIGYALSHTEIQLSDLGLEFSGPGVCYLVYENQEFRKYDKILLQDSVVKVQTAERDRFTFLGRTDQMINRGGIKISLDVAEAFISQKFKVKCAALSLYDERLGDELGFIIQAESEISKQAVLEAIKQEWGFKLEDWHLVFDSLPLNANGKLDRIEATKRLLKKRKWTFPFNVENLRMMLPHKGPAIWVDSILEIHPKGGVAQVELKASKNYFSPLGATAFLRESACIEWIAQTYGYIRALSDILEVQAAEPATRTFIAEVRSSEFHFKENTISLEKVHERADIHVHCTHDFGSLKVIQGKVIFAGQTLCEANLKVYSGN